MRVEQGPAQKPNPALEKLARFNYWTRDRGINVAGIGGALGFLYPPAWGVALVGAGSAVFDQIQLAIIDRKGVVEKQRAQEMGIKEPNWINRITGSFNRGSFRFFNSSPRMVTAGA